MFKFVIKRRISSNLSPELMSLTDRFISFSLFRKIALLFTRSFFILQVLFVLENDFAKLGYLLAIAFLIEAISAYPFGVIKDHIGYQKVLFLAYVVYGIAYFLLTIATNFIHLVIVLSFESLGYGLDSESLQSWFDKNYSVIASDADPERKIYSKIFARTSSLNDLIGLGMAILGGYIAFELDHGRDIALLIQSAMMFILAIVFGLGVKDYYFSSQINQYKRNLIQPFFNGIVFVLKKPEIFILSLGLIIDIVIEYIWLYIIMIPLFYAYTGNEFYISLLNFGIFIISFIYLTRFIKNWAKINPRVWLPRVYILQGIIFYGSVYFLIKLHPGNDSLSSVGITVLFLVGSISTILLTLVKIFTHRLLLDSIPNEERNGYYSLLPTAALLVVAFLNFFAGRYIEENGFDLTLIGLMGFRIIGGIFIFLAIATFGLAKVTKIELYDENYPLIFESSLDTLQYSFLKFKPTDSYLGETTKIVWMKLLEVARKDGNVSNDELDLLTSIMIGMKDYFALLEKVFEDQIITLEEAAFLATSRNKIIKIAREQALKDEKMTSDEEEIINRLSRILEELEKVEQFGQS